MRRLLVMMLLLGGMLISPAVSKAGFFLGSFENPTSGQDSPDEAVIAAILAATGQTYAELERLFKNDVDDKGNPPSHTSSSAFGFENYFEVKYTPGDDKYGGEITQVDFNTMTIGGLEFVPLFYTAKIDGGNAGFNLYQWEDGENVFSNVFYREDPDTLNPQTYTYSYQQGQNTVTVTNPWTTSADGIADAQYAVSHISVWGGFKERPTGSDLPVPEPSALAVWGLVGILGLGWRMKSRFTT